MIGALSAAHQRGVIHRDVKPGNILLTPDGRAKLADFGIAKSTDTMDHTQTGLIIGTPSYLAPERLESHPATAQSDLYAMGVVLYEALTGERPFRGDTPIALAHSIHATTPVPIRERLPDVDPALARAVDAAMAKDPGRRPSSAEAMLALVSVEVDSFTETQPVGATAALPADTMLNATQVPTHGGTWRNRRDRRQPFMIGIAAITLLVAVGLITAADEPRDAPSTTTTRRRRPTRRCPSRSTTPSPASRNR